MLEERILVFSDKLGGNISVSSEGGTTKIPCGRMDTGAMVLPGIIMPGKTDGNSFYIGSTL